MATRYAAIPAVPQGQLSGAATIILISSLKENVELLTGTRGEEDNASKAIPVDQIRISTLPVQIMSQVSAKGTGHTISNVNVADLDDVGKLINDVQLLANDVLQTRNALNALIAQLKGG